MARSAEPKSNEERAPGARRSRTVRPSLALLEDVSAIISRSEDLRETLEQITQAVA